MQVSSIVWNSSYKELITGHGFTHNQLTIWKYPNFTKVAELTGLLGFVPELILLGSYLEYIYSMGMRVE